MTPQSKIWVLIETRQGKPVQAGLEILGKTLDLDKPAGWSVAAVLAGHGLDRTAGEVAALGPDEVVVLDHPLLADYCNTAFVKALEGPIKEAGPEVLLLGATAQGTDLGPRLAARLRTGLSAHCIDLELTPEGGLLAVVPGWGGSLMAKISCPQARPQMATVMPGVFPVPEPREGRAERIDLEAHVREADLSYKTLSVERREVEPGGLETAEVVVAGGWGLGSPEGWSQLQKLAKALGGAVGATRPAVDEGWAQEKEMIGTSGRSVRPRLYLGVALSGHSHHLVGLKDPELAVAINSDPAAPIFQHCHIGLVGDYKEILPALLKHLAE